MNFINLDSYVNEQYVLCLHKLFAYEVRSGKCDDWHACSCGLWKWVWSSCKGCSTATLQHSLITFAINCITSWPSLFLVGSISGPRVIAPKAVSTKNWSILIPWLQSQHTMLHDDVDKVNDVTWLEYDLYLVELHDNNIFRSKIMLC